MFIDLHCLLQGHFIFLMFSSLNFFFSGVHAMQDQAVDLQELANVFTIEIQNNPGRNQGSKGTKAAFASLRIASRVPLLVKDPATEATMETQSLLNDVHTLRLDMNPQEVRHIACNLKSRHFKGGMGGSPGSQGQPNALFRTVLLSKMFSLVRAWAKLVWWLQSPL